MAKIQCGHCWQTHETVAQVRECSVAHKGGTLPPPWWSSKVKAQPKPAKRTEPKRDRSPSLPSNVKVDADGNVTWTNPKHNPWKDIHHQYEQGFTDGEYTRRKARAAVENEFRGTDDFGFLCPNMNCRDGYCHYRATVNASWCPSCETGMTAGSHEVFKPGYDFEPKQWYMVRIARWVYAHARKPENYNAGWDLVVEARTLAELVDQLVQAEAYTEKKAIQVMQEWVDLMNEQRRAAQNEAF